MNEPTALWLNASDSLSGREKNLQVELSATNPDMNEKNAKTTYASRLPAK
jgi:hypothetical protein